MKNHQYLLRVMFACFLCTAVCLLFVIPPLRCVPEAPTAAPAIPQFSVRTIVFYSTAAAICLFAAYYVSVCAKSSAHICCAVLFRRVPPHMCAYTLGAAAAMILSAVCCNTVFFKPHAAPAAISAALPDIFLLLAGTAFAAAYEEVLYRLCLPLFAYAAISAAECRIQRLPQLFCVLRLCGEAACIAVFACSHRINGIPAVINAAAAGGILRFVCVKTHSLYPGIAAHTVYNCVMYAAYLFM